MSARRLWLVDVEVAGVPYRWAVEETEVETADGDVLVYAAGLQDFSASADDESIDLEVLDEGIDWPAVAPAVEGSACVVRRWSEGTVLEAADTFLRGVAGDVEYGTSAEGAAWTVTEVTGDQHLGTQAPDPLALIDDATWTIPQDTSDPDNPQPQQWVSGSIGKTYPILLGYPGWDGETVTPVVPVYLVQLDPADQSQTWAIVSEDLDAPITSVRIYNASTGTTATEDVSAQDDLLGHWVRVVDFGADARVSLSTSSDSADLFAGFSPTGGGGVARTAYEVVVYLCEGWAPASADFDRLRDVEDWLSGFLVDDHLDEPVGDVWGWLGENLLPDLPVEIRSGVNGRYLVPLRFRPVGRPVGTIVAGSGATRVGRAKLIEPSRNEFCARYRFDRDGNPAAALILTAGTRPGSSAEGLEVAGPTRVVPNGVCRKSQARYGVRTGDPIDLDWCRDTDTVLRVLQSMADRDATTPLQVAYLVDGGERYESGDEVEVVDDDLGIDAVGIVDGAPTEGPEGVTVTVRILVDA